jgi:hypothetical protein
MIIPQTNISLLNTPFSSSQDKLLKFSSLTEQQNYMDSKVVKLLEGCKYQREGENEYIDIAYSMDSLYNCNYVRYQNSHVSNRYFYAFIIKMEWKSSSVTRLYIKMDSYQTFQFDFTLNQSFIDRKTFITDYYNTLADTPTTGDLKVVFEHEEELHGNYFILFNADPTKDDCSSSSANFPTIGNYTLPCYMCLCQTASEVSQIIQAVSNKGRADRIQACYYSPYTGENAITGTGAYPKGDLNISSDLNLVSQVSPTALRQTVNIAITYNMQFKKELCYPYAKLEVVDRITGKSIELDLSKFNDPFNPSFYLLGSVSDSPEYKIIPLEYNGAYYSIENALVIEPSSELPIFSNSYAKYMKNNSTANMISGVLAGAGAVGSILSGNVAGAVSSFGSIAQIVNADSVAKSQPNQVSNIKGDASEYLNYNPSIYFRLKVMDSNHMDIARKYWNCYGYPERKIDYIGYNENKSFNFVKTVSANITSNGIPNEYVEDLQNIFDKGVTIWNRNYLDYSAV